MRRALFLALALFASPAAASPQSLASDPALMPALDGWQRCMVAHVGPGEQDAMDQIERVIMHPCAEAFRPLHTLIVRHHAQNHDLSELPVIDQAYRKIVRRYTDAVSSSRSLAAHPEYRSLGRGCYGCGE